MTTDNRTTLNACDANTNWTGDDGTPTSVTAAGLYYENTNSLSFQHTNAPEHTYYTDGTGWDLSDASVFLIVKVNQQDSQANGGMQYVLGDGTNRLGVEVGGSDNTGVSLSDLFYGLALDVTNRNSFTLQNYAGVNGNYTPATTTQVGYGSNHLAKAQGAVDNVYLDRLSFIANDSAVLTINGGTVGTPETWTDVQGDDVTNGWGVCGNPFADQFQINCSFDIGTTAAADSYFTMSGVQLYLLGTYYAATHFFWGLQSNAGQTNQLVIDTCQIISIAGTTGVECDLNWNNTNFNNLQVDGSLFVTMGNVTLPANTANRWIRTTTFESPTTITPNGMELSDCVLSCGANTSADGLLVLDTAGDSNQMANVQFNDDGAGHAILITATGTYDFDNFTFSAGFTGTGTDAAVYNNSGGAVTINVQNGGDTPSVRNGAGASTTINNAVAVRVDGVAEGTAIRVVANETVGTITVGDTILQGLADSTGALQDTGFNYEAAFDPSGLDVLVRARNQGLPTAAVADDGGVLTDETAEANSGTVDDMTLTPATPAQNDAYYWGHPEQYAQMKINISTAATSLGLVWEYWNGAWTALSGVVDGTSGFTATGLAYVTWTLPGDWATTTINSQGPYYYIRARVGSATPTGQALGRWSSLDVTRYLPIPPQGNLQRTITSAGLTATLSQAEDTISIF